MSRTEMVPLDTATLTKLVESRGWRFKDLSKKSEDPDSAANLEGPVLKIPTSTISNDLRQQRCSAARLARYSELLNASEDHLRGTSEKRVLSPAETKVWFSTDREVCYQKMHAELLRARKRVLFIGGGVDMDEEPQHADNLLRLLSWLGQSVECVRIEAAWGPSRRQWILNVAKYLVGFRRLRIFVPAQPQHFSFLECCVVDPGTDNRGLFILSSSANRSEMGFALFTREPDPSLILNSRIAELINPAAGDLKTTGMKAVKSGRDLLRHHRRLFGKPHEVLPPSRDKARRWYFAYGTDIAVQHLRERAPSAEFAGFARCPNHRPFFARPRSDAFDAVPTILPGLAGRKMPAGIEDGIIGCLYRVSEFDLNERLRFYHNAPDTVTEDAPNRQADENGQPGQYMMSEVDVFYRPKDDPGVERLREKAATFVAPDADLLTDVPFSVSQQFVERLIESLSLPSQQGTSLPTAYREAWAATAKHWRQAANAARCR